MKQNELKSSKTKQLAPFASFAQCGIEQMEQKLCKIGYMAKRQVRAQAEWSRKRAQWSKWQVRGQAEWSRMGHECESGPPSRSAVWPGDGGAAAEKAAALCATLSARIQGDDTGTYYNPANSMLSCVLRRGRGIPISLSCIAAGVAHRIGLRASGVNAPQHFLMRLDDGVGDGFAFIDAFSWQVSLDAFSWQLAGGGAVLPPRQPAWSVLMRMLRNLYLSIIPGGRSEEHASRSVADYVLRLGRVLVDAARAGLSTGISNHFGGIMCV